MARQLGPSPERRAELIGDLQAFFASEFDEDLSEFRAEELLTFMIEKVGPSLYNQGIADARAFLSQKLDDLDTEFPIPES